jgi:hypothetical protein
MFYQLIVSQLGLTNWTELNLTRDVVLNDWLCPFLSHNFAHDSSMGVLNMGTIGALMVFASDRIVDSEWPITKSDYFDEKGQLSRHYQYYTDLKNSLREHCSDVTLEIATEAYTRLNIRSWKSKHEQEYLHRYQRSAFFICPFGDDEIDHNYRFVIKPIVEKFGYQIARVDEISHSIQIPDKILQCISQSTFVVADLTLSRPNCYYEVGYAHALAKPAIILAKTGTDRHFDIGTYQWNYWDAMEDLQPKFDDAVQSVIRELAASMNLTESSK